MVPLADFSALRSRLAAFRQASPQYLAGA